MIKTFYRIPLLFIIILVAVFSTNGQNIIDKKTKKYFKKGIKFFKQQRYTKSLDYFDKAIKRAPAYIKPHLYKASAFYELKQYKKSEKEYHTVLRIDSSYNNNIYYSLGHVLEKQKRYEEALKYYTKFLKNSDTEGKLDSKAKIKIRNLPFIISAVKNPVDFNPIALNDSINSGSSEYLPSISGDNMEMIFTRRVNRQEDLFSSTFTNGIWRKAEPIYELNTLANESAHSLSSDGKTLIFTICARGKTIGNCDLFISKKENGRWSKPRNLGAIINSPYWDSQPSISSDNKTLFFSSNRPGGIGGKDIWVSRLGKSNRWTKPVCLDSTVNTKGDDQTPFIHADNKTLYFTSNGHPGMGGTDLYYSNLSNGKWNKAINLGYPINTEYDEGALFVSLDGKSGYFSADRTSHNNKNIDIYYFELPEKIKPQKVTFVKGLVFDDVTKAPLKATINLFDNASGEELQSIYTVKDSFFLTLPYGKDYNFTIQKEGYAFYSDRFVLDSSNTALNPFRLNIGLLKLDNKKESKPIVLNNVFFETNSSKLDEIKSKIELKNLISLLTKNPNLKIELLGHTDNTGNVEFNLKLSRQRAKSLENYLLEHNIDKHRIKSTGFGESQPIAPNDTPENRSKNRRVEFRIIGD